VTCGLGGAFAAGTHELPAEIVLGPRLSGAPAVPASAAVATPAAASGAAQLIQEAPGTDDEPQVRYERADATWPPRDTSRRLAWGVFRLPFRNPGFWGLTGGAHAAFLAAMLTENFLWTVVLGLLIAGSAIGFTDRITGKFTRRLRFGVPHALVQVLLGIGAFAVWQSVAGDWPRTVSLAASIPVSILVTGLISAEVVAAYLLISSVRGAHLNEVFAAQSIEDHKGFARLHIGPHGVTVYPVGVEKVCRRWNAGPGAEAPGEPLLVPGDPIAPVLVEAPFTVPRVPAGLPQN
jgi:hypothetical protein